MTDDARKTPDAASAANTPTPAPAASAPGATADAQPPAPDAAKPSVTRILWIALRDSARVAGRAHSHFSHDDGWMLSGYIAYAVLLALFPFMIFTAAFASAAIGPEGLQTALDWLFAQAPANVADALAPVLTDVLGKDRGGLLTIAAAGAIWAASNGVEAFRAAFDRAYESRHVRGFVLRRLVGLGFVILGSITFATLGFAIVLAPLILKAIEALTGFSMPIGTGLLRYAVGIGAFIGFLWVMHRFLPSRPQRGARLLPGIVATLVLWMIGATAFSVYLSYAPSYSVTYGGISGVIVTLLFFYLTGAAIIFGAEVNAALERRARLDQAQADKGRPDLGSHDERTTAQA